MSARMQHYHFVQMKAEELGWFLEALLLCSHLVPIEHIADLRKAVAEKATAMRPRSYALHIVPCV